MNPSEMRMMWMSQYNPERISLEEAASYFGHHAVGLSVMDDLTHQTTMDCNPMMSIVGGDYGGQAAVAAAALGVQPTTTLITANPNEIYSLAQVGGLHQQLLQQSAAAAAVFHNFSEIIDEDNGNASIGAGGGVVGGGVGVGINVGVDEDEKATLEAAQFASNDEHEPQMYDDNYDEGISGLTPKQEIINIDDFVMMTDSNSYDGPDYMSCGGGDKDLMEANADAVVAGNSGSGNFVDITMDDNELLTPLLDSSGNMIVSSLDSMHSVGGATAGLLSHRKLPNRASTSSAATTNASSSASSTTSSSHRSQRKTRKIEPVNRPGLELKTPIAYKGNIDPSVIPIHKDGMAVCERCGAIGVKHTFYTKSRRFCSMACARGELYSLVVNNNGKQMMNELMAAGGVGSGGGGVSSSTNNEMLEVKLEKANKKEDKIEQKNEENHKVSLSELEVALQHMKQHDQQTQQQQQQHDEEDEDSYRFTILDDASHSQHHMNGSDGTSYDGQLVITNPADMPGLSELMATNRVGGNSNSSNSNAEANAISTTTTTNNNSNNTNTAAAALASAAITTTNVRANKTRVPCPQLEKIISVRRRNFDPTHSFDWVPLLASPVFYAAPVTCFQHALGYDAWDGVGIDMKVEVENTDCDNLEVVQPGQTPHSFWVATILNICGYKALVRYEGFEDPASDFWVNLCNAEVHSVGWCAMRGKPLIPPRSIGSKYDDWKDFLVSRLSGARTLPSHFYNKVNDSMQSRFRLGLNLECVDKDCISQVRLATVTKIVGKRLFLRYFDSDDGFWCHEDSPIIHPVGWATTVGHNLAAPRDYLERMLAGREAMIEVHEDDATIELFKMNFTFEEYYLAGKMNGFIEGMKLEAVDPLNLSSVCVATVMAVLKFGYMMIRIDSYQPDASGADWFCYHEKSPSIFPAGFCVSNKIQLTPPNGYENVNFHWDMYLQETGAVAAGPHLFHRVIPDHGFEVGMSLECADLMDPRLVCVATVARVVGRLLKIHFDGWTDEYDQWLDCESPDVYPVGWCTLVNHKLEGPPAVVEANKLVKTPPKPKLNAKKRKKRLTPLTSGNKLATGANNNEASKYRLISSIKSSASSLQPTKSNIKLEMKPEQNRLAEEDETENVLYFAETKFYGKSEDDDADYLMDDTNSCSAHSNQSTRSSQQQQKYLMLATSAPAAEVEGLISSKSQEPQTLTSINIAAKNNTNSIIGKNAAATAGNQSTRFITSTNATGEVTITKKSNSPAPPTIGRKATSYINSAVSNSKYIPRLTDMLDAAANSSTTTTGSTNSNSGSSSSTTPTTATLTTAACSLNAENISSPSLQQQNYIMPDTWNVYDVSQFLRVNDCTAHCDLFSRNKVDGKRLLLLSKDEIVTMLGMKVGPALKIYDLIQQLKCKINPSKSRLMQKANKSFL